MSTINDLNTTNTLEDDDKLLVWKRQSGATRAITATNAAQYFSDEISGNFQPFNAFLANIASQAPNTQPGRYFEITGVDTVDLITGANLLANIGGLAADPTLIAIGGLTVGAGDYIEATGVDTFRARKLQAATYAELTAIPAGSRFDGMVVYVASRASEGDGGDGYWRFDAASSATADGGTILAPDAGTGRWSRVFTGAVSPKWFGALGDGINDDTAAFVAAIATGKDVMVVGGVFLVSEDQIEITTAGQGIYGLYKPAETEFRNVSKIKFTATSGNIIYFKNTAPNIANLIFEGPSETTSATAIRALKTANTDDLDMDARGLLFITCQVGIDATGRGFDADDIGFANVSTGFIRRWPTSGIVDGGAFQNLPWGWRKDKITNIRLHASKCLLDNSADANLTDYQVLLSEVTADQDQCAIFRGACKNSIFSDIKAKHGTATTFVFTAAVVDTIFDTINASGTPSDTANSPGSLMSFASGAERCTFGSINGGYIRNSAILITGNLVDCTMEGIVLNNVNTDATGTAACIDVTGNITRCAFSTMSLRPGSATGADFNIRCGGVISDSYFSSIAYDRSKNSGLLVGGAWTDGGGNVITNGRFMDIDKNRIGWATVGPVSDDASVAITPPRAGGVMIVVSNGQGLTPDNTGSGIVYYDVGSSLLMDIIPGWTGTTSDNLTVSTSARGGTDGADGSTNIGISGGQIQFENRRGATVTYQVAFI